MATEQNSTYPWNILVRTFHCLFLKTVSPRCARTALTLVMLFRPRVKLALNLGRSAASTLFNNWSKIWIPLGDCYTLFSYYLPPCDFSFSEETFFQLLTVGTCRLSGKTQPLENQWEADFSQIEECVSFRTFASWTFKRFQVLPLIFSWSLQFLINPL